MSVKMLEQVKEFHATFNQPVLEIPSIPVPERCKLRYDLIAEELEEFKDAYEANDIVGVADALTDLLYVVFGSHLEFGLGYAAEELFDEVQKSNMSKLDENGQVLYKPNGKVRKSDLFVEPNLREIVQKHQRVYKIPINPLSLEEAEQKVKEIAAKFKKERV